MIISQYYPLIEIDFTEVGVVFRYTQLFDHLNLNPQSDCTLHRFILDYFPLLSYLNVSTLGMMKCNISGDIHVLSPACNQS